MEKYYYVKDEQRIGPVAIEAIKEAIMSGDIIPETLIWYQGLTSWIYAKNIPEMSILFAECPPPIPVTKEISSAAPPIPTPPPIEIPHPSAPNFEVYIRTGNEKFYNHDFIGAIELYSKAIELNPNSSTAYYNRGIAKTEMQDYINASTDFANSAEIEKKYPSINNTLKVEKSALSKIENKPEPISNDDTTNWNPVFEASQSKKPSNSLTYIIVGIVIIALSTIGLFIWQPWQSKEIVVEITLPEVVTAEITEISENSAKLSGTIKNNGGGELTQFGFVYSTNPNPDMESNKINADASGESFFVVLSDLEDNTMYYVKAFAENIEGISFGEEREFLTVKNEILVTDIDGNVYKTVEIGNQLWMAENLKTTKFRDGSNIPERRSIDGWEYDGEDRLPAWCNYLNKAENGSNNGRLYNWFAVSSTRQICPEGWKVPSQEDFETLLNSVGGTQQAFNALKEGGTSGFNFQLGGWRNAYADFSLQGTNGYLWSSSQNGYSFAWQLAFYNSRQSVILSGNNGKEAGFSVRCIQEK
jgi:uncharacterized protein (TIGR02145 family)